MDTKEEVTSNEPTAPPAAPMLNGNKVASLVVDSGPILKGQQLYHFAEKFYTIAEVVTEIRDQHSREFLAQMPFQLEILAPSEQAIRAVLDFSKKTGDYSTLSVVDIKVLALTYMLEVEANGIQFIRTEPIKARTQEGAKPPQLSKPKVQVSQENEKEEIKPVDSVNLLQENFRKLWNSSENANDANEAKNSEIENETSNKKNEEENGKSEEEDEAEIIEEESGSSGEENEGNVGENNEVNNSTLTQPILASNQAEEEESDGGEWITPENIHIFKQNDGHDISKVQKKPVIMKVACITSDYAIQNVLLQMGLNLVSTDGHRIKRIKTWVLRCHACFKIVTDMEKKFCPRCGNASLTRVSCSTDEHGNVTYYLKKNFQFKIRGSKYPIPKPQTGRKACNIVLREDQSEYLKAMKYQRKKKLIDVFDPDYIPSMLGGVNKHENYMPSGGSSMIGHGRKNPNEAKRKSGRRKK